MRVRTEAMLSPEPNPPIACACDGMRTLHLVHLRVSLHHTHLEVCHL